MAIQKIIQDLEAQRNKKVLQGIITIFFLHFLGMPLGKALFTYPNILAKIASFIPLLLCVLTIIWLLIGAREVKKEINFWKEVDNGRYDHLPKISDLVARLAKNHSDRADFRNLIHTNQKAFARCDDIERILIRRLRTLKG